MPDISAPHFSPRKKVEASSVDLLYSNLMDFFKSRANNTFIAEDLCQDCFLILFTKLRCKNNLHDSARIRAYSWGIARRLILSYWRKKPDSSQNNHQVDDLAGATQYEPLTALEQKERLHQVAIALKGLSSARDREILLRRYAYDESINTISEQMLLTNTSTKVSLHRARNRLKESMDR